MTNRTREIAQEDWRTFFDGASRHYYGREVKIEVFGPDLGVHVIAQGLPLIGMTLEQRAGAPAEIELVAGDLEKGHVTHVISNPRHLWIDQEINGGDNAIKIESGNGHAVILELSAERQANAVAAQQTNL